MKNLILFTSMIFAVSTAFSQAFDAGDKVEVYNSGGWYAASVVKAGADNYSGYYYVQYEKYNQGQWIQAKNIRKLGPAQASSNDNKGPRNGTYIILSYGNPASPIRLGYFELNNGHYIYYNLAKKRLGDGNFAYDKARKLVQWTSGPFKDAKWGGGFEIDREGKTQKIRLNGATIGSNSTDSN